MELLYSEHYEARSVKAVSVTLPLGDATIAVSDDGAVHVEVRGDPKYEPKVSVRNGTLSVTCPEHSGLRFIGVGVKKAGHTVAVQLPPKFEGEISGKLNCGNLKIEEFPRATVAVDADLGDISIAHAQNVKVESALGKVSVGTVTGQLEITASCGDVKVEDAPLAKSSSITNSLGTVAISQADGVYIDAETSLGEVKFANGYTNTQGGVPLTIRASCGDIKVGE